MAAAPWWLTTDAPLGVLVKTSSLPRPAADLAMRTLRPPSKISCWRTLAPRMRWVPTISLARPGRALRSSTVRPISFKNAVMAASVGLRFAFVAVTAAAAREDE